MQNTLITLSLIIPLAPLAGALLAGLFGKTIRRSGAHWVTIIGVAVSFICSVLVFKYVIIDDFNGGKFTYVVYQWLQSDNFDFHIGFLIDGLTAVMLLVVTFVSLMVHIYTIGYMKDDPGYQRFFSYIALFTFSMLMLVMADNFLQLFFGWEAVGLVSYLLIGFWYKKETAIFANLKAFLVNRVGDFGFLLGIAGVLYFADSLNYAEVFAHAEKTKFSGQVIQIIPGVDWSAITVICILLFIGAMGKSAQVPLHVWLPDSMEGPTPISALIHAATMVTAGIFMVSRMSPLFVLSETAMTMVLLVGAITALFMGLLGLVQNDIKRVVAYSTLSQLGYMTVALGTGAFAAGMFHLMTHAFFKALLFLGAGSVIIAMHHQQDMRKMGNLKKYLPITYWTALIGSLALIGFPGFSGFYSKDIIIEATRALAGHSQSGIAQFAYFSVLAGVLITALYTFRMFFMVFHGKERMDDHTKSHLKEPGWVVTGPLIFLAIPSLLIGLVTIAPMLFGGYFSNSIQTPEYNVLGEIEKHMDGGFGVGAFTLHGLLQPPFILALTGIALAWFFTLKRPDYAESLKKGLKPLYLILVNHYFFDRVYQAVFAGGARKVGNILWNVGDRKIIDGLVINGSARTIGLFSRVFRKLQTGYLFHYAMVMVLGLLGMLTWLVWPVVKGVFNGV